MKEGLLPERVEKVGGGADGGRVISFERLNSTFERSLAAIYSEATG